MIFIYLSILNSEIWLKSKPYLLCLSDLTDAIFILLSIYFLYGICFFVESFQYKCNLWPVYTWYCECYITFTHQYEQIVLSLLLKACEQVITLWIVVCGLGCGAVGWSPALLHHTLRNRREDLPEHGEPLGPTAAGKGLVQNQPQQHNQHEGTITPSYYLHHGIPWLLMRPTLILIMVPLGLGSDKKHDFIALADKTNYSDLNLKGTRSKFLFLKILDWVPFTICKDSKCLNIWYL